MENRVGTISVTTDEVGVYSARPTYKEVPRIVSLALYKWAVRNLGDGYAENVQDVKVESPVGPLEVKSVIDNHWYKESLTGGSRPTLIPVYKEDQVETVSRATTMSLRAEQIAQLRSDPLWKNHDILTRDIPRPYQKRAFDVTVTLPDAPAPVVTEGSGERTVVYYLEVDDRVAVGATFSTQQLAEEEAKRLLRETPTIQELSVKSMVIKDGGGGDPEVLSRVHRVEDPGSVTFEYSTQTPMVGAEIGSYTLSFKYLGGNSVPLDIQL